MEKSMEGLKKVRELPYDPTIYFWVYNQRNKVTINKEISTSLGS